MDIEDIRKLLDELAAFMKKNDLAELELDVDGAEVKLKKTGSQVHPQMMAPIAMAHAPVAHPSAPQHAQGKHGEADMPGTIKVTSPMVGTFYRAPKPDAEPFVDIDSVVDEEKVVCIIEAMKVMNEIKAEKKGKVVKILVENGEPVEFGQPLFLLEPS